MTNKKFATYDRNFKVGEKIEKVVTKHICKQCLYEIYDEEQCTPECPMDGVLLAKRKEGHKVITQAWQYTSELIAEEGR